MDDTRLVKLIAEEDLRLMVGRLGEEISRDYQEKDLVVVGVLKGSVIFFADLVRAISCPMEMDFVRLASYGADITSSGNVVMTKDLETCIEGRHVLVVEDIVDTGHTTRFLLDLLHHRRPADVRVCSLLRKRVREPLEINVDYVGAEIEDRFVVGYGMDHDERYRSLPAVYMLKFPGRVAQAQGDGPVDTLPEDRG